MGASGMPAGGAMVDLLVDGFWFVNG